MIDGKNVEAYPDVASVINPMNGGADLTTLSLSNRLYRGKIRNLDKFADMQGLYIWYKKLGHIYRFPL